MRPTGYYWVRFGDGPAMVVWYIGAGEWLTFGSDDPYKATEGRDVPDGMIVLAGPLEPP